MTITLTKPKTQVVWRSPDAGDKTTSIPGSVSGNKGFELDVKSTIANGDTFIVTPTFGTIGGAANFTWTEPPDEVCNLQLVSDADNADWIIRCLCCLPVTPYTIGAVSFTGTPAGWNFPAMSDSPVGSLSVWLYMSQSQFDPPYTPVGGDIFNVNRGYLLNGPDTSRSMYIGAGGMKGATFSGGYTNGNTINNITATSPAVITFANPHGVLVDSVITRFSGGAGNDPNYYPPLFSYHRVTTVSGNSITVDYDASAATGVFVPESNFAMDVCNTLAVSFVDPSNTKFYTNVSTTRMPQEQWTNLLMSWDMNHASGSRVLQCFFDDAEISFLGGLQESGSAFDVYYSNPDVQEGIAWYVCSNGSGASPICYMAELWFAPGQFIDFTDASNRAKFHAMGKPVSIGPTGLLPTGTSPILYLTERADRLGNMPLPSIDASASSGAFVGNNEAYLQLDGFPFANGILNSKFFMLSMWIDRHTVGTVVDANSATITLDGSKMDVLLFGNPSGAFEFQIPYSAGDGTNIRIAVDMDHVVGAKTVKAYVGTNLVPATVTFDNTNNMAVSWNGYFRLLFYTTGYFGDIWIAPDQFFDPVNDFVDNFGNPIDLGPTGANTTAGVSPSIYFHVGTTDPASAFANNLGTAGSFSIQPPSAALSLQSSTPFFNNATGLGALNMRSDAFDFEVAPSSPTD